MVSKKNLRVVVAVKPGGSRVAGLPNHLPQRSGYTLPFACPSAVGIQPSVGDVSLPAHGSSELAEVHLQKEPAATEKVLIRTAAAASYGLD